jgi:hypothetical protein
MVYGYLAKNFMALVRQIALPVLQRCALLDMSSLAGRCAGIVTRRLAMAYAPDQEIETSAGRRSGTSRGCSHRRVEGK